MSDDFGCTRGDLADFGGVGAGSPVQGSVRLLGWGCISRQNGHTTPRFFYPVVMARQASCGLAPRGKLMR